MRSTIDGVALVYAEGAFNTLIGKTAHGLVRFTQRYDIAGVIDSTYAGQDAGMVLAYTGVGKKSRVVELGTGTGFMTIQLANIVKSVVTYEKRKEFAALAKDNVTAAGLKNVKFKFKVN